MKCKRCENEVFGDFDFCSDECRKLYRVKKKKIPNFIKRVSVHNASNGKVLVKKGDEGPVVIRPGYAATVSLSVEVKRLLMAGVLEMM